MKIFRTISKRLFTTSKFKSTKLNIKSVPIPIKFFIKDPCKFCKGTGILKCLECDECDECDGHKNILVTDYDGDLIKIVKCHCINALITCNFCGGSGKSHLIF